MNKLMNQLPEFVRGNKFFRQDYIDELGESSAGGEEGRAALKDIYGIEDSPVESTIQGANLISSQVNNDSKYIRHYPIIDCDYPVAVLPSSTKDHYHLFIGKSLSEAHMDTLVKTLTDLGLMQNGVKVNQWDKRKALFARVPWVKKGDFKMPDDMKAEKEKAYNENKNLIVKEPAPEKKPDNTAKTIVELALVFQKMGMEVVESVQKAKEMVEQYDAQQSAKVDDPFAEW